VQHEVATKLLFLYDSQHTGQTNKILLDVDFLDVASQMESYKKANTELEIQNALKRSQT